MENGRKMIDFVKSQKSKEAHREWRRKQIEAGKCTICGKADERTQAGRTVCNACLERARRNQAARDERLRAERRCTRCGKVDARTLSGLYLCEECEAKHAQQQRDRRARHVDGTCHRCGKIDERTQGGRYLCAECAADARFRSNKYNRKKRNEY